MIIWRAFGKEIFTKESIRGAYLIRKMYFYWFFPSYVGYMAEPVF